MSSIVEVLRLRGIQADSYDQVPAKATAPTWQTEHATAPARVQLAHLAMSLATTRDTRSVFVIIVEPIAYIICQPHQLRVLIVANCWGSSLWLTWCENGPGGECLVSSRKSHASYVLVLALGYGIVKMSKVQHQSILAHSALILSNNHSAPCIVQYSPTTTRALDGRAWLI